MTLINYRLLGDAMQFYEGLGYTPIEVPWIVPYRSSFATFSDESRAYVCKAKNNDMSPYMVGEAEGFLIGSAEQGIIERIYRDEIECGEYVSCSPCYRNEPVRDELHQTQFMKVELSVVVSLIDETPSSIGVNERIEQVMHHARSFMQLHSPFPVEALHDYNQDGEGTTDLTINGIEVGSYGMRILRGMRLLFYGTGLALPRFENAISSDGGDSL